MDCSSSLLVLKACWSRLCVDMNALERGRIVKQAVWEVRMDGGGVQSGDHVKVVNGAAAGQRGMVVSVDTETGICVILTDAHKEELRVFTRDLSESHETPGGDSAGDKYVPNVNARPPLPSPIPPGCRRETMACP